MTNPAPVTRVEPKYPINAAKNNREGWTQFSFFIETDGSVSNVLTLASSRSKDINRAAKNSVLKWQYQPAIEQGKPVQQSANFVQLDFKMAENGASGVSRRFLSNYN